MICMYSIFCHKFVLLTIIYLIIAVSMFCYKNKCLFSKGSFWNVFFFQKKQFFGLKTCWIVDLRRLYMSEIMVFVKHKLWRLLQILDSRMQWIMHLATIVWEFWAGTRSTSMRSRKLYNISLSILFKSIDLKCINKCRLWLDSSIQIKHVTI